MAIEIQQYMKMQSVDQEEEEKELGECQERGRRKLTVNVATLHASSDSSSQEDIFQPEFHAMKKLRLPIRRKISKGSWTLEENKVYYNFLVENHRYFATQTLRRIQRIFCKLSDALQKKRTPDQCRSHHQKLFTSSEQSIDVLISRLQQKIRESERLSGSKTKTRTIGKHIYEKLRRQQRKNLINEDKMELNQQSVMKREKDQIRQIYTKSFYTLTTFRNTGRILLEIEETAVSSYSLE